MELFDTQFEDARARHAWLDKEIYRHDTLYHGDDNPEITDQEYDALRNELNDIESKYPELVKADNLSQKVGGAIKDGFSKITHAMPMLSLGNAFSEDDVSDFITRVQKFLNVTDIEIFAEQKIDGSSCSIRYENGKLMSAATRGDGAVGEDITLNIKTLKGVPHDLPNDAPDVLEVRGEVYMPTDSFEKLNLERAENNDQLFANPRNAALRVGRLRINFQLNRPSQKSTTLKFRSGEQAH